MHQLVNRRHWWHQDAQYNCENICSSLPHAADGHTFRRSADSVLYSLLPFPITVIEMPKSAWWFFRNQVHAKRTFAALIFNAFYCIEFLRLSDHLVKTWLNSWIEDDFLLGYDAVWSGWWLAFLFYFLLILPVFFYAIVFHSFVTFFCLYTFCLFSHSPSTSVPIYEAAVRHWSFIAPSWFDVSSGS